MSPTVTTLDQLDHATSVAFIALGVARSSWDRCPSAENARVVEEAEGCVNRLLDERFVAQQHVAAQPPAVGVVVLQDSAG